MSVFLDCFKNNGYDYLRIVDGRRFKKEDGTISNKRTTIKNLGHLKNFDDGLGDGLLLRLREQFKNRTLDIGMDYDEVFPKTKKQVKIVNAKSVLDPKNIGYFFLENIYNQLGISQILSETSYKSKIEYDLNGLTKLLVFGRILKPESKKKTFENRNNYLFPVTKSNKINDIYKSLDVLDKKSKAIQIRINTKIKQSSIGRNTELTYYDVTNYFFETMYGDDDVYALDEKGNKILDGKGKPIILEKGLRKKGVCKANTLNPLVAMGLFIDNNGIPVSYDLFPGNTQDKTTFKNIIEKSIINKQANKVIVVADNGIYAQENMYLLVTNGNGYIISKAVKKHWNTKLTKEEEKQGMKPLREWALDEDGYVYSYDELGNVKSKTKSRIYKRTLKDSNDNNITIKEKQVFIKVVQVDKKTGEVLKTKPLVILLEDKIEKYKETMGFYSIVTSEITMDDKEVKRRYHGLSRIEDSFRIIKSDLAGRPIYVWTKEHINAHFLICYISLTIIRLIQHKILTHQGKDTLNLNGWESGITAEKIKETLNKFQANHIGDGYYQLFQSDKNMEHIIKAMALKINLTLPDISQINGLKKKILSCKL